MTSPFRRAPGAALAATLCTLLLPAGIPAGAHASSTTAGDAGRVCRASTVPVSTASAPVVPGDSFAPVTELTDQQIFVRFCQPKTKPSATVQVLIHGITYDHRYWNIADPDGTQRYSWEAAAAKAGYATLAIDRLGAGRSAHPPSFQVDINSNAAVVRALVHALRVGEIAAPPKSPAVRRVVLVGHSYGSITSWFAASGNPEVDAVLLTGATHNVRELESPVVVASPLYPAVADPAFADSGLDPGYLVDRPGTRYGHFYAPDTNVDPRVLTADEATKGTVTFSELNNYPVFFRTPLDIRVPVFLLIGSRDGIFCSLRPGDLGAPCADAESLIASEGPQLGSHVPSVEAHVVDGAGHALNALRSSQESFTAAHTWLRATVAP